MKGRDLWDVVGAAGFVLGVLAVAATLSSIGTTERRLEVLEQDLDLRRGADKASVEALLERIEDLEAIEQPFDAAQWRGKVLKAGGERSPQVRNVRRGPN